MAFDEPIRKHPERPDAGYRMKRNRDSESHGVSTWQMKEQPPMPSIRGRNATRPERAAAPMGCRIRSHRQRECNGDVTSIIRKPVPATTLAEGFQSITDFGEKSFVHGNESQVVVIRHVRFRANPRHLWPE